MPTEASIGLTILCVLILTVAVFFFVKKRPVTPSHKINSILQSLKQDEVKEIIIPDGIGGLLEIEHLILMEQGLLLIETYSMAGNIFGSEQIDQWTQIIDGRSFKFANPLRHIRTSRQALKVLAPNTPIFCRVIFSADSVFPKGKPEEVSTLNTLAEDMQSVIERPAILDKVRHSWGRIMRIARKNGQAVLRDGD